MIDGGGFSPDSRCVLFARLPIEAASSRRRRSPAWKKNYSRQLVFGSLKMHQTCIVGLLARKKLERKKPKSKTSSSSSDCWTLLARVAPAE